MKTTYEVVVQRADGQFYSAELEGREGVPITKLQQADMFARQLSGGEEVKKVLVVERRVLREYNGAAGRPKEAR